MPNTFVVSKVQALISATDLLIICGIAGLVVVLCLCLIIRSFVYADRDPGQYGPRIVAGQPKKHRPRGIGRAMLDTLPIIEFGNTDKSLNIIKRDLELGFQAHASGQHPPCSENIVNDDSEIRFTPESSNCHTTIPSELRSNANPGGGESACAICAEDFIQGQYMRVLPCNHHFHPQCIDPWLLEISDTCPLWYECQSEVAAKVTYCKTSINAHNFSRKKLDFLGSQQNAEQQSESNELENPMDGSAASTTNVTPNHQSTQVSITYLHGLLDIRGISNSSIQVALATPSRAVEIVQRDAIGGEEMQLPVALWPRTS